MSAADGFWIGVMTAYIVSGGVVLVIIAVNGDIRPTFRECFIVGLTVLLWPTFLDHVIRRLER